MMEFNTELVLDDNEFSPGNSFDLLIWHMDEGLSHQAETTRDPPKFNHSM